MTKTDHKCATDASFMILCCGSSRGHCNDYIKYCIACTAADLRLCFRIGKIRFSHEVAHSVMTRDSNLIVSSQRQPCFYSRDYYLRLEIDHLKLMP